CRCVPFSLATRTKQIASLRVPASLSAGRTLPVGGDAKRDRWLPGDTRLRPLLPHNGAEGAAHMLNHAGPCRRQIGSTAVLVVLVMVAACASPATVAPTTTTNPNPNPIVAPTP